MNTLPSDPDTIVNRMELGEILTISPITLARWARRGEGPPVIKLGPRRVVYRIGDVKAWLASRTSARNTEDRTEES